MALTAKLYREDDNRAAERHEVHLDATLRGQDQRPLDVVVDQLSVTGFRMSCADYLPIGASVSLGIAGIGRQSAQVVRRAGDRYGCRFDVPLASHPLALQASPSTVVAAAFGPPEMIRYAADETPPLDAFEQSVRKFRGVIILTGLALPWMVIVAAGRLLLG
jgi:hypothetical protein